MGDGDGGDDLISALHDDLLCKIISRLPVKDGGRTAVLASRWRHLWRCIPLVLSDEHLSLSEPTRAASVSQILVDHPGPFDSVILHQSRFLPLSPELVEWPRLLAAKDVQRLAFVNQKPAGDQALAPYLCLPADILRCASLERLFLAYWTLPDPLFRSLVAFPHLRTLGMVNITMSDQDLDCLLAASPVLEIMLLSCPINRFHLRSQSLRSVLAFPVEEFVVVEAPLLERLIFLKRLPNVRADPVRVKISSPSKLRVLGFMEPMIHKLHINGNIIKHDTMPSPSTVVPGIKILALRVNFCVLGEVKMVPSLLRCFPNVYTLHLESLLCDPSETATGEHHGQFWQGVGPVECLRLRVKRMVFHNFQGHQNEFEFLKFVARDAKVLKSLLLVPPKGKVLSGDEVTQMIDKLGCPWFRAWTSKVLLVSPKVENHWSPITACMITGVNDPFC
uniref:Uncharacterized protein n=1 Tax=Avena sativa TaxID=4498 RepID=A0ACD5Z9S2_AVESA